MRNLKKIKFVGQLNTIIGNEIEIAIKDIPDLILALRALYPESAKLLGATSSISIACVVADEITQWLSTDDCLVGYIPPCDTLLVCPDLTGAGAELAVLLLAEIGVTVAVTSAAAIIVGGLISFAASYVIGRIVSSLATKPETANTPNKEESYLLGGPQNNTKAGAAVPLLFGRFRVGSVVVSQSVISERVSVAVRDDFSFMYSGTGNLLDNDYNVVGTELDQISIAGVTKTVPCTFDIAATGGQMTFARNGTFTTNSTTVIGGVSVDTDLTYIAKSTGTTGGQTSSSTARITVYSPNSGYNYGGSGSDNGSGGFSAGDGASAGSAGDAAGVGTGTA